MPSANGAAIDHVDTVFRAFSNRECRRIVYYLWNQQSASRSTLADVLAGWEATERVDGYADSADRQQLLVRIVHNHVPRLVDVGLVEYDRDSQVATLADLPPWVERCLDAAIAVETASSPVEELLDRPPDYVD